MEADIDIADAQDTLRRLAYEFQRTKSKRYLKLPMDHPQNPNFKWLSEKNCFKRLPQKDTNRGRPPSSFEDLSMVQSGALNRDKISSIFATAKRRNFFKKIPADSRYYGSTSIL